MWGWTSQRKTWKDRRETCAFGSQAQWRNHELSKADYKDLVLSTLLRWANLEKGWGSLKKHTINMAKPEGYGYFADPLPIYGSRNRYPANNQRCSILVGKVWGAKWRSICVIMCDIIWVLAMQRADTVLVKYYYYYQLRYQYKDCILPIFGKINFLKTLNKGDGANY